MSTFKEELDLTELNISGIIMKMPAVAVRELLEELTAKVNPIAIEYLQSQKLIENLAAAKSQQALKVIPVPEPINTAVIEALMDAVDALPPETTDMQKIFLFVQAFNMLTQASMTWINEQFRAKGVEILHDQIRNNESRIIKPF